MKSEWRVTSNIICDQRVYGVYRLRDVNGVDHSGNREYDPIGYVDDKQIAIDRARELNRKGQPNEHD